MKKLSQEEAAKVLEGMKVKIEIPKAAVTQWERNTALDMAIEALKYSEVPNSSDCISRQAAIETARTMYERCDTLDMLDYCNLMLTALKELPSAQPEIVRCKDCKYVGTDATCCLVCDREGMGLRPFHVRKDDYCSYAERRTDG